jgi:acetyltransferase-like isoleucine patch superfamily enzyme
MKLPISLQGSSGLNAVRYVWYRSRLSFLSGQLYFLVNFWRVGFPFFKDSGARIWYPEKFSCGKRCFLGRGVHINALSTGGVILGDRVTIGDYGWVQGTAHLANPGKSLTIESHVYLGPFAVLGFHGPVRIGANTAIGAGFRLSAQEHNMDCVDIASNAAAGIGIDIGRHCWFGNDVKVLDGVVIGDHCVIGAGSVVTQSIPSYSVAVGVPARVIKTRKL